jgi:hypothetical protein
VTKTLSHPNTLLNCTDTIANSELAIIPGGHGQYIGESYNNRTTDFKESDLVVPMIEKFLDKKPAK